MNTEKLEIDQSAVRRLKTVVRTYYDVQDVRIRTDHRIENYADEEALVAIMGEGAVQELRVKPDHNVAYKKAIRDIKKDNTHAQHEAYAAAFEAAVKKLESDKNHKKVNDLMGQQEDILKRQAMDEIEGHPLWESWLSKVRGIGPCLAGGVLSLINIRKCPHVGNLWSYAGLGVVVESYVCPGCQATYEEDAIPSCEERVLQGLPREAARCSKCNAFLKILGHGDRRTKGQTLGYNPDVKTLAWKIGESFVKQPPEKSKYRLLYQKMRAKVDSLPCNKVHYDDKKTVIPCFDAHRFAKAKRATVKIFFSHIYSKWRGILGLPVTTPFALGMLGHDVSSLIEPLTDE